MKWIIITIAAAGIIGLGFISKRKPTAKPTEIKSELIMGAYAPVAVLELFTSEGCSSCPSADRLLPELIKSGNNIIPLSFHVDYWNRLGWTDPFSNSEYSERQHSYARQLNLESVYTPQLVVNGEYELVGSNKAAAESAIKKALGDKATVQLSIENVKKANDKLSFTVRSEGDFKKTDLLAVLVQKKATMNVKAGENSGAKLSHINVVRVLSQQQAGDKNEFELGLPANISNDNWQLVIYTQRKTDLKITGAIVYNEHQ